MLPCQRKHCIKEAVTHWSSNTAWKSGALVLMFWYHLELFSLIFQYTSIASQASSWLYFLWRSMRRRNSVSAVKEKLQVTWVNKERLIQSVLNQMDTNQLELFYFVEKNTFFGWLEHFEIKHKTVKNCSTHFWRAIEYFTNMTSLGVSTRNNFPERGLLLEGVAPGQEPSRGKLFLVDTPQECHICFIIPNKIQNTKVGKIANTSNCGWILVVCLVELLSPAGHSANSLGVHGYSLG